MNLNCIWSMQEGNKVNLVKKKKRVKVTLQAHLQH